MEAKIIIYDDKGKEVKSQYLTAEKELMYLDDSDGAVEINTFKGEIRYIRTVSGKELDRIAELGLLEGTIQRRLQKMGAYKK